MHAKDGQVRTHLAGYCSATAYYAPTGDPVYRLNVPGPVLTTRELAGVTAGASALVPFAEDTTSWLSQVLKIFSV